MSYKISSRSSTLMNNYIKYVLGENGLTKNQEIEHLKKYGFERSVCAYCGNDANTLDHIYSVIEDSKFTGYDNSIGNLLPCCQMCNSSKGKKTIEEWLDVDNEKLTKGAKRVKEKKDYSDRRKKIDEYIKNNKSNEKEIESEIVDKLNEKAEIFKKIEEEYLSKLNKISEKDREYFKKLKKEML